MNSHPFPSFRQIILEPGQMPNFMAENVFLQDNISWWRDLLIMDWYNANQNENCSQVIFYSGTSRKNGYEESELLNPDEFSAFISDNKPRGIWDAEYLLTIYEKAKRIDSPPMSDLLARRNAFMNNPHAEETDPVLMNSYGYILWTYQLELVISYYLEDSKFEGWPYYIRLRKGLQKRDKETMNLLESIKIDGKASKDHDNLLDYVLYLMPYKFATIPLLHRSRALCMALNIM